MKKLLIILGFFAVMIGLAVYEIVATTDFYSTTVDMLAELETSMELHEDSIDGEENLAVLERLEEHWDKGQWLILMFCNHTVIRNVDERITALGEYSRQNEFSDAMVSLRQTQRYVTDLMRDVYPSFANLL